MFCKYCGNVIDDDSIVCKFCGKRMINSTNIDNSITNKDEILSHQEMIICKINKFKHIIRRFIKHFFVYIVLYTLVDSLINENSTSDGMLIFSIYGLFIFLYLAPSIISDIVYLATKFELFMSDGHIKWSIKNIFTKKEFFIPIHEISSLLCYQKFVDKLFNTYNVSISSSSGNVEQGCCDNGAEFVNIIQKYKKQLS